MKKIGRKVNNMNDKEPTVSIIIPTYNRAYLIERSIKSVLDQTYKDFEVIIVDDASTDNTEEIIRLFENNKIKYVKNETNKGANAARNTGLQLSKGKYVAFQDSDDEWLPTKLEKQINILIHSDPKIGVVYTGYYRIKNNVREYIPSSSIVQKEGDLHSVLLKKNFIGMPTVVIKKECFEKVGMFDERLPRLQDWEMWIRISKHYEFKFIDTPLVLAHYQQDSITNNQNAVKEALKIIVEKHFDQFCKEKEILSSYYYLKGNELYFCKKRGWSKYYLNAIKLNPVDFKRIISIVIALFGQNIYEKIQSNIRKLKRLYNSVM